MDGSSTAPNQQSAAPMQQASLIRPEQVKRLPHLSDQVKAQQEVHVQRLWDTINKSVQGGIEHTKALSSLQALSSKLMQGMRQYQNMRKQQAAAQAGQQGSSQGAHGSGNSMQFKDLSAVIQQKVNAIHFTFPPAMVEGTPQADEWLKEAKARYGQALQRLEVAKSRRIEFQRAEHQRRSAGNPYTQEEVLAYQNKIGQCDRAINESNTFMVKFREQQASFQRQQQSQQRFPNQGPPGFADSENQPMMGNVQANTPQAPGPPGQGPTAHSISSAVSAARSQANTAQATGSPSNEQGQSAKTQMAAPGAPPSAQSLTSSSNMPYNAPQGPMDATGSTSVQYPSHPRSLSQQAAISQSAQSHVAVGPQGQPQSGAHAHPTQSFINPLNPTKKDERLPITKNLQVTAPKPVPVPPARPTLNGGPGVGMPGQMGQPAIPSMPGYVLEHGEDGRILSKKKLNELVREVVGPGPEDQLTPEVEEVSQDT